MVVIISLYDSKEAYFDNNGIVVLSELISCTVTEELNGMYELELESPLDNRGKWKYLFENNIVKADGQLFRIYRKVNTLNGIKVNARHIFYDLLDNFLEDVSSTNQSGADTLNSILSNTQYTHNFTSVSDVLDLNTKQFIRKNPVDAIMNTTDSIISTWGGELIRDNFTIQYLEARGLDRGFLIAYAKNIQGIEETLDTDGVCTRLMPIGKDGLLLPEKYIDSPYINNFPNPKIKIQEFSDIGIDLENNVTEAMAIIKLRIAATKYILDNKIDIPTFNYKIDFIELSKTEEYKDYASISENIYLGDIVTIKHSRLNINLSAKVIKITKNCITNRIEKIELGNFKSNIASSFTDIIQITKEEIKKTTNYLDLQIQEMDITLSDLSSDIDNFSSDGYITRAEANALKNDLLRVDTESKDIIDIAITLEITTEKDNFVTSLNDFENELRSKWIDQPDYPIVILSTERETISILFKNVTNAQSILENTIELARQDDGKKYVEDQVTELNTALSALQLQVNVYVKVGNITEEESNILDTLFVAVQTESDDIIAIADELKELVDGSDLTNLNTAENNYSNAISDALNSIDDWLDQTPTHYPIKITVSKGKTVNNYLKKVENTKEILNSTITQIREDNELTYADQQIFEANIAIASMQEDIKIFAKGNKITYDESISLKASFDKILAESSDVINIANTLTVSTTLINNYQNSLTGTVASCGVDGLQVELAKWIDLPLIDYPKVMKTAQRNLLLDKFKLVLSTKLTLNNAITLKTPEYSIDGEISIRGTGAKTGARYLKINKKTVNDSGISGRGLMLTVISREDLSISFTQLYDTYNSDESGRNALATKLNSLDDTVIVVLTSNISIGWNQTLLDAMIRCGGTGTDTGTGSFPFVFIGIPGLFRGCALELYYSSDANAPYAIISTKVTDGVPQGIAMGSSLLAAKAQLTADEAKISAENAMEDLDEIADNGKITKSEKVKTLKPIWDAIVAEYQSLINQASIYAIDAGTYTSSYNALNSYLNITILSGNTTAILSNLTTSLVDRTVFDAKFNTYYTARGTLLELIVSAAKIYADTKASYLHIKYSNYSNGNPFTANSGETAGTYMGTYSDNIVSDSMDYTRYTWTKVVGDQGIQGPPGSDGTPRYIWIKYATDIYGSNLSDDPTSRTHIGIAYNKTTSTESSNYLDYSWSLIKGNDGSPGTPGEDGSIVKEVYIPLYYPDHKSYVSTSSSTYKALTVGTSTLTLFTSLTTASLLHTMSASSELGWMALEVVWKVSSGGRGEIDIFNSGGLPCIYMEPYDQSLPHMTTQSDEYIKQRTLIDFFIAPNTDIYVAVKATEGTCYISRVDLVIKPW